MPLIVSLRRLSPGEPELIRPESSGLIDDAAPVAASGRGFVAPIWRGFRGIGALRRGPPDLLTRESKIDPVTPRIGPQTLSLSVNPGWWG